MDDNDFWRRMQERERIISERHFEALPRESEDVIALLELGCAPWEIAVILGAPLATIDERIEAAIDVLFGDFESRPTPQILGAWAFRHGECCMRAAFERVVTRDFSHLARYRITNPLERAAKMASRHVDWADFERELERRERHRLTQPPSERLFKAPRRCNSRLFSTLPFDFETGRPRDDS
jgi:hypothetical protein